MTTTADPLSAGFVTMSLVRGKECNALRSSLVRLSCLGLGGLWKAMADSTLLTNVSRS